MNPERKELINGILVEEYYWAGKLIVYQNNRLVEGTYEEVINKINNEKGN